MTALEVLGGLIVLAGFLFLLAWADDTPPDYTDAEQFPRYGGDDKDPPPYSTDCKEQP